MPTPGSPGERPALTLEQRQALRQAAQACGLRGRPALRGLTDAQRQCVADQGVTLPERPSDGTRPNLSIDQRVALRRAAIACGLPIRGHHHERGGDQI